MAYRDCPCLKCNSGKEREKRIKCRRKCTQFVAWKLSMQAMRQKKKKIKTDTIHLPKENSIREI